MNMHKEGRKQRSDKKRSIAPFIPDEHRVWIHRIARICSAPEGVVGLQLIQEAINDEACIVFFSSYFKRDFRFTTNTTYCGHDDCKSIYSYLIESQNRSRFKVKPTQMQYEQLCEFQFSLGISYLSHATFALLQYALHDLKTIRRICPALNKEHYTGPSPKPKAISSPVRPVVSSSTVWSILK